MEKERKRQLADMIGDPIHDNNNGDILSKRKEDKKYLKDKDYLQEHIQLEEILRRQTIQRIQQDQRDQTFNKNQGYKFIGKSKKYIRNLRHQVVLENIKQAQDRLTKRNNGDDDLTQQSRKDLKIIIPKHVQSQKKLDLGSYFKESGTHINMPVMQLEQPQQGIYKARVSFKPPVNSQKNLQLPTMDIAQRTFINPRIFKQDQDLPKIQLYQSINDDYEVTSHDQQKSKLPAIKGKHNVIKPLNFASPDKSMSIIDQGQTLEMQPQSRIYANTLLVQDLDSPKKKPSLMEKSNSTKHLSFANLASTHQGSFLDEPRSAILRKYDLYKRFQEERTPGRNNNQNDSQSSQRGGQDQNNGRTFSSFSSYNGNSKQLRRGSSQYHTVNLITQVVENIAKNNDLIRQRRKGTDDDHEIGDNRDLEQELTEQYLNGGPNGKPTKLPRKLHKKFKQQTINKFRSNYFELEKSEIKVKMGGSKKKR